MQQPKYFIGLMSGTSADGVDAALIKSSNHEIQLIDFISTELPTQLKQSLLKLNANPNIHLEEFCSLHKKVADSFISATQALLSQNTIKIEKITAIGSHGQTIYHAPDLPMTLQIGHPAFIAKNTGITTVADFRVDDMALGGQGAPFAPAFHKALFSQENPCFVVNIGGIANVSCLPGKQDNQKIIGWDTGPGNSLMDEVCHTELNIPYDPSGKNARQGNIHNKLLNEMLKHPYFLANYPKSTGRDTFHAKWVKTLLSNLNIEMSAIDLLATLCELTALSIAQQIKSVKYSSKDMLPLKVWVVGGGAYNDYLLERLQLHLKSYSVASSQLIDINPSAVEAMMCAWLAEQRLNNKPVELASVTGAKRNAVLGGTWHP
ncbi:anhydro-N-acetylmuramic acid kinase [Thiomicrorhabdus lithotrophica]|uniref:Anhydro-N-acetylmuramic acid kinase n=1 Tax=Thiomicrorhabdus lithotrophica TaxID=2949997 RepID=A0ABY8CAR2_9GAMM|nr:anhydro-N-acetylmuramic acid kinase [Thiomicrorhabdus lithotrophica]WEJ63070.1 anhydro-N-acetylmuramic acid kinase [Thiomicrorhabdus lithotrophica]